MIPEDLLRSLYTRGSLENVGAGVQISLKNRLADATITQVCGLSIADTDVDHAGITIRIRDGNVIQASTVTETDPIVFSLGTVIDVIADRPALDAGPARIAVDVATTEFGRLRFETEDDVSDGQHLIRIPRDRTNDYTEDAAQLRRAFVEEHTAVALHHIPTYSVDPPITQGNIENFIGVAQIPMGLAGPMTVNGEHAKGDFIVPLATTEGTLVASYSRGMKVMNLSGGITTTIVDDRMQRAPAFVFADARDARAFAQWVAAHIAEIAEVAESTGTRHRLLEIETYLAARTAYLRFNFSTGDAAGQNIVSQATHTACRWILDRYEGVDHFYLEANLATDKKASQINILRTRGKRVIAEAEVSRKALVEHMRVEPESLLHHHGIANVGSMLAGSNNNGLHAANGLTALFIATGQDVANVAESSAAILHAEPTDAGDLYMSITLPSLIVATHGGGTQLATQSEALQILGCLGTDKVGKLAEIAAALVLAGELSLAAAISSSDWVSSHEQLGRNR